VKNLVVGLLLAVAACSGKTITIELTDTQVELDIYSGLPNPRWQLTADEATELESRLVDLPASARPIPDGKLGYRGFVVHDDGRRIQIGSGLVIVSRGEQHEVYEDKRGAEDWLYANAVQRGHRSLIAHD
jgi:hypothetical protein